MKEKLSPKATFLIVLGLIVTHYFVWIHYVGAFPSENGHYNFYAPMGSYLYLSEMLPDHGTLMTLFPDKFPHGIGIFLYIIWKLGLSTLFTSNPWIIFIPVLILIGAISWMAEPSLKGKLCFLCGLYFFPISQITLKSFSIHCIIIYLFMFAILIYHSNDIKNLGVKYAVFTLAVFLCMTLKHLGIVLVFCYAMVQLLCFRSNNQAKLLVGYIGILLIISVPFYLNSNNASYSFSELALHNPHLSSNLGLLLPFILSYIVIFVALFTRSLKQGNEEKKDYPSLFKSPVNVVLAMLLIVPFFVILDLKIFFYYGMFLSIILFFLGIYLLLNYRSKGDRAIFTSLFFASYSCATFLYGTRFAITGDVFYFSFLLMIYLFFKQCSSFKVKLGVTLSFVLLSSFMPNYLNLKRVIGSSATSFYQYYVDGFHQNPLSWQKSTILKNRKSIQDILIQKDLSQYGDYCFSGFVNMHPFQFQVLETLGEEKIKNPHIKTLIRKIENDTSSAFIDYRERGEDLFLHWLKEKQFLYFVHSTSKIQSSIYDLSSAELCKSFLNNIDINDFKNNYPLRVDVSIALQNSYYFWLKTNKLLAQHYEKYILDQISFYILKGIPLKKSNDYQPFGQLIDLYKENIEIQDILQDKGSKHFEEMLDKAKASALEDCKKSKVLCQAIQESIIFFSIDKEDKRRALITLEKMDKDWSLNSSLLQEEYSKFTELIPKILDKDARLANAMMTIAQRKFSENYNLIAIEAKIADALQGENILKRSQELWIEGNKYLDMNPPNFKKALPYLKKAITLNPNSHVMRKDYDMVMKNLN
ncbi:MAG: hypothetical protein KC646_14550 [Candidatus Cloacimonetes bacterium]|nr:hypothetical protein [Candidatus Cloacimonadota bacterium]